MRTLKLALIICFGLTACGQTGPLYLPEPSESNQPEATDVEVQQQQDKG